MAPFSTYWRRVTGLGHAPGINRSGNGELAAHIERLGLVEVVGHVRLWMTKETRSRYLAMRAAAEKDGIVLLVFRAFLSVEEAPGCGEHQTGRALDIGTTHCFPPTLAFEKTAAYAWLTEHAGKYGFTLSYPGDNRHGLGYEPWHWALNGR